MISKERKNQMDKADIGLIGLVFCLKNSLNPFAVDHIQQYECRAYRTL
jgi:hypothetical protein